MAPSSAAAATARIKLLSLASFGLISGACFFVGYYLLRRYRKATQQETDDSSEEKLKKASVSSPLADDVFDKTEFTKEVVCKTGGEHLSEGKELKEKEEDTKKEDDPVQERNAGAQHVSASGALNATEIDQREGLKDVPISVDAKDALLHDDSSATEKTADAPAKNKQRAETTSENESRNENKEVRLIKTTGQETGSEPRLETAPAPATTPAAATIAPRAATIATATATGTTTAAAAATTEVQTGRKGAKVPTEEAPRSEHRTALKAAELTAQKPSSSKRTDTKTVEAKTDKEPRSVSDDNGQQSATIKQTKASSVHSEKQSPKEKGKVSETKKSVEPTVQKPSGANRNETKPETATAETSDEIALGGTAETFNETAAEQQSATLEPIKATDASTNKNPVRDVKEPETTTHLKATDESINKNPVRDVKEPKATDESINKDPIRDVKEPETPTPLIVELQKLTTSPETVEKEREPQKSSEFPRVGKSHIPEPVRRSADDRQDLHLESLTNRKPGSKSPLASPTGKEEARTAWSESQQGPKESRHSGSGGIGKGQPLNVHAASFRPHNKPYVVDGGAGQPSTGRSKANHTTETSTNWADSCSASVASSQNNSSPPGEQKTPEPDSSSTDDTSSEVVVRSTKSLLPLAPLTPPPDTNKQSRRNRDRGIRGSAVAAAADPASEGGVAAVENQSRRSRHRWPPLDDNKNLDRVEVDTSSQQVSWKTNKKFDATQSPSSGAQSPWSSSDAVQDEPSSSSSEVARKVEFDDNFVDPVSSSSTKVLNSPDEKTELTTPSDVTKQSSLLSATPDCVLERKPLISEEDDDDDDDVDADDNDGVKKQFARKNSAKNGNEERTGEANSNDDSAKLVEVDQNGLGSLIGLAGEKTDPDVRLASLRALVNVSWASEKHPQFPPVLDQLCANIDSDDASVKLESLRVLVNLSKNPAMVPHLLAAKAPNNLLKLLVPELSEEILINWLTILDDILWTSKELCLTFASLPTEHRAASPETMYTGLYGLKNARILKSRIFVLSRHKSQQVTYLASRIYSCLTS